MADEIDRLKRAVRAIEVDAGRKDRVGEKWRELKRLERDQGKLAALREALAMLDVAAVFIAFERNEIIKVDEIHQRLWKDTDSVA
jgi:hypothetical protein